MTVSPELDVDYDTALLLDDIAHDRFIHYWKGWRTLCGSTLENHSCRTPDGGPVYTNFLAETHSPCCGKPLCPFCKLLITP